MHLTNSFDVTLSSNKCTNPHCAIVKELTRSVVIEYENGVEHDVWVRVCLAPDGAVLILDDATTAAQDES